VALEGECECFLVGCAFHGFDLTQVVHIWR
jgi:hypothetical protein